MESDPPPHFHLRRLAVMEECVKFISSITLPPCSDEEMNGMGLGLGVGLAFPSFIENSQAG